MVIATVQGASCFGPAYEFARMANAGLRKRKGATEPGYEQLIIRMLGITKLRPEARNAVAR